MPTSPASEEQPAETVPPDEAGESPTPQVATHPGGEDEAAEVAALQMELARAEDRYQRARADLDNYRKRVERDGDQRASEARRTVLIEWLQAVDSVERALRLEPGDPGLVAVRDQMDAILARHGLTRLGEVGERFDPERHEAIAAQPTTDAPDYTVLEVARSGFGHDDGDVLRPAQVVVARQPAGGT